MKETKNDHPCTIGKAALPMGTVRYSRQGSIFRKEGDK